MIPDSREMLRELPVVMWLQVACIVFALVRAAWAMRGPIQQRLGKADKLHSSEAGGQHTDVQPHAQPVARAHAVPPPPPPPGAYPGAVYEQPQHPVSLQVFSAESYPAHPMR